MKFCVNCKHFINGGSELWSLCMRKTRVSEITGKTLTEREWAWAERGPIFPVDVLTNSCGRRARFFELKEDQTGLKNKMIDTIMEGTKDAQKP